MIKDDNIRSYVRNEVREPGYTTKPCVSCMKKLRPSEPIYFIGRVGATASLHICERCWISMAGENFLIETPDEANRYFPKTRDPWNTQPATYSSRMTKDGRIYRDEELWRAQYQAQFVKPDKSDYGREVLEKIEYEEIFGTRKKP